jgi:hypothetical protein
MVGVVERAIEVSNTSSAYDGDKVLKNIERTFCKLDRPDLFPRSQLQKEIHRQYLLAIMHHIYGTMFLLKMSYLKAVLGVDSFDPRVALTMPRRCGKTESMAMFDAVILICMIKNFVINIFSSCERASKMLKNQCYAKLCTISKEAAAEITVNNSETLELWSDTHKAKRVLNSYPGGVRLFFFSIRLFVCMGREDCKRQSWTPFKKGPFIGHSYESKYAYHTHH